ncbi:MAG TPA: hypothetical protein VJ770_09530 [Stellaceae bacterium]|nr:hypothetical protein [Stellaceae bacterium]
MPTAPDLPLVRAGDVVRAGQAYLADTPLLRAHAGTQPDLFLRWNEIPLAAAAVDVVVFVHGHSREGRAMPLAEKVARSGLDLAQRPRPTLALLPRGHWFRHYYYDFPALLAGGLDRLVDYGLDVFGRASGRVEAPMLDRLVLAAHSGGGMPAVDMIAEAGRAPDEFFVFDGLYGRDPATGDPLRGLEAIDRWLGERLAREPERSGALRIVFIENQTGPFSRAVGQRLAGRLAALDPGLAAALVRRYRVESAIVQHSQIARHYLPELLRRADAQIDWPS